MNTYFSTEFNFKIFMIYKMIHRNMLTLAAA